MNKKSTKSHDTSSITRALVLWIVAACLMYMPIYNLASIIFIILGGFAYLSDKKFKSKNDINRSIRIFRIATLIICMYALIDSSLMWVLGGDWAMLLISIPSLFCAITYFIIFMYIIKKLKQIKRIPESPKYLNTDEQLNKLYKKSRIISIFSIFEFIWGCLLLGSIHSCNNCWGGASCDACAWWAINNYHLSYFVIIISLILIANTFIIFGKLDITSNRGKKAAMVQKISVLNKFSLLLSLSIYPIILISKFILLLTR